jgi:hypothetical protein
MWFNDGKVMIPGPVLSQSQSWLHFEFIWGTLKTPDARDYKLIVWGQA